MRKSRHDGTHTANAEQVDALKEEAWIPIFKMHELGTQPNREQFEASVDEHIRATSECVSNELQGEKLKNQCKKMKKHECSRNRWVEGCGIASTPAATL